jgi:hypothetical protein
MDIDNIDIDKATGLVNSWANAFRTECEEQFPGQGDLVFHSSIAALFCELFRMFDPELIREQANGRLTGAGLPYRIATPS